MRGRGAGGQARGGARTGRDLQPVWNMSNIPGASCAGGEPDGEPDGEPRATPERGGCFARARGESLASEGWRWPWGSLGARSSTPKCCWRARAWRGEEQGEQRSGEEALVGEARGERAGSLGGRGL